MPEISGMNRKDLLQRFVMMEVGSNRLVENEIDRRGETRVEIQANIEPVRTK
jgi:hypothetical protein